MRVHHNSLVGPIPSEVGSLSLLVRLHLRSNDFEGEIPSELGLLSYLEELDCSDTRLSGSLPPELGLLANKPSVGVFDVTRTSVSGAIPDALCFLNDANCTYEDSNGVQNCSLHYDCGDLCGCDCTCSL